MSPDDIDHAPPATTPAQLMARLATHARERAWAVVRAVERCMVNFSGVEPDGSVSVTLAEPDAVTPAVLHAVRAHYTPAGAARPVWDIEWEEPVLTLTPPDPRGAA
jgi:hypothetical protein